MTLIEAKCEVILEYVSYLEELFRLRTHAHVQLRADLGIRVNSVRDFKLGTLNVYRRSRAGVYRKRGMRHTPRLDLCLNRSELDAVLLQNN